MYKQLQYTLESVMLTYLQSINSHTCLVWPLNYTTNTTVTIANTTVTIANILAVSLSIMDHITIIL